MIVRIRRWDGQLVDGALSRGSNAFAARDWRDLFLGTPGAEIANKLKKSSQLRAFDPPDQDFLRLRDGMYSDLQSINSEDSVTWAAFRGSHRGTWIVPGLKEAFGLEGLPSGWNVELWSTSPGPSPDATPPEADVDLVSDSDPAFHFTVEAKWKQDLKDGQDVSRTWNQLDMRAYVAHGVEHLPRSRHGVLVIVPPPSVYIGHKSFDRYFTAHGSVFIPTANANSLPSQPNARGVATTVARAMTWARIADLATQEGDEELGAYLRWRLACFDSVTQFVVG